MGDIIAEKEASCSRLPPELLNKIFAYLHLPPRWDKGGDRRALCACRLVNRLWAEVAYRHTFSAITVYIDSVADASVGPMTTMMSLPVLREFFVASPDLCEAVQTLRLVSTNPNAPSNLDVSCLHSIFSVLPNLRHLCLDAVCGRFVSSSPPPYKTQLSVDHIEVLKGSQNLSGNSRNLTILVNMFEEIGDLTIDGVWLVNLGYMPRVGNTRVHHLHYPGPGLNALYKVMQHLDTQHLRSLSLAPNRDSAQPETWRRLHMLLQAVGPQLTRLGIYFKFGGLMGTGAPAHIYTAIFDACTGVQTLCFSLGSLPPDSYRTAWELLVGAILHLPRSVHLVILEVDFGAELYLLRGVEDMLHKFEEVIAERSLPTIVSIRPVDGPMFGISEQTKLVALFPRLSADAALQF